MPLKDLLVLISKYIEENPDHADATIQFRGRDKMLHSVSTYGIKMVHNEWTKTTSIIIGD